ncbi:MAG TPA: GTPase HflX [Gammaproteobacteria bacterium]|jgi:GTP-binding protein HflX|nr:GTPase HflX [Gammaproteobacteria bacterium]HIG49627.1 GTPase HflX [Gammaproteobacteria bacterium]|tara:strand:- start:2999 stop:4294 length:1296 start_codon:yes stop_codon:yes gene_type:complete
MVESVYQKAVIVQVEFPKRRERSSSLKAFDEFRELVLSSGAEISDEDFSKQVKPTSGLFITKGKAERIKDSLEQTESELVIFNHDLTPSQERNLENIFEARVLDRTGLILDIFAVRASSHIGKLQVELAQLSHLSTRLVRGWSHLERQKGGIGLRGPGETQLETDRRLINQRIKNIKNKLSKSHKQREINRYSRKKSNKTLVALVGYTNAGKTTLFNLLTESQLYVANKLFATLDSVTRKNSVSGLEDVLFSDTVGFISDLPTELIESFKATLDELKSADILVHVVDISDPDFIYKTEQVLLILKELGISNIPCIRVNNKSDKVDIDEISEGTSNNNNEVWVSALKNTGMENLVNSIQFNRKKFMIKEWIELQPNQGKIRSKLYSLGRVLEETTSERGLIQLQLEIDKNELNSLISNKGIDLKNNKIKEAI